MDRTCAFYTLGCKLNFSETATISREFTENQYKIVEPEEIADIYVINTCTVTNQSDKKCRNIIRKLHRQNPEALIVVTGCYAELKSDEIVSLAPEASIICIKDKSKVFEAVKQGISQQQEGSHCDKHSRSQIFPAYSTSERTRSFLKVQDGCDYYCTYCAIPFARGASRNIPIAQLVKQAKVIAQSGVLEIVITGVNTGDFGKSTGESFLDLLKALNEVEGILRYRISSIEPNLLTDEILDWIAATEKFLPHFHIPLQSGSDSILAGMKRRYNTQMFRDLVHRIRCRIPNVFLGIDVIVGFPGESEQLFRETYDFLEEVAPSFLHIFPYSKRDNTIAASMPNQVSEQDKKTRVRILEELSDRLHDEFVLQNKDREELVLFEEGNPQKNTISGYTKNYIRVERPYDPALLGKLQKVFID